MWALAGLRKMDMALAVIGHGLNQQRECQSHVSVRHLTATGLVRQSALCVGNPYPLNGWRPIHSGDLGEMND